MSIRRRNTLKHIDWILPHRSVFSMWLNVSLILAGAYGLVILLIHLFHPFWLWPITGSLVWTFDAKRIIGDAVFGIIFGFFNGSLLILYKWWIHR